MWLIVQNTYACWSLEASIRRKENEYYGIIGKLGERVFEKVCHFFIKQNLQQYGIEFIEVNLSAIQAADENLAQDYIRIMEKQQIEPRHINLEITEFASVSAKNILLNNMNVLMEQLGIQYIQGYYYSKPLSEEHFLEFIKEKNADKLGGVA